MTTQLPTDASVFFVFCSGSPGMSDVFIIFSGLVLPLLGGVFVIGGMDLLFVQFHCRPHQATRNR